MQGKKLVLTAFVFYIVLLVWLVLFKLELGFGALYRYRELILIPFYRPGASDMRAVVGELVLNVAVFVPLGLLLSALELPKRAWARVLAGLLLSLVFETAQFFFALGTSDVTDLINNTAGTALGVLLFIPIRKKLKEKAGTVTAAVLLSLQLLAVSAYAFLFFINV